MALASLSVLREREANLQRLMEAEVRAHATTLEIALEEAFAARGTNDQAKRLINRLRENSRVYGVILFDDNAQVIMVSSSLLATEIRQPPELERVINLRQSAEFTRLIGSEKVFSVILPIEVAGELRGALEVVESLAAVEAEIQRTRRNFLLTTLLLLAVVVLLVYLVLRREIARPVRELLGGAQALSSGNLSYRVNVASAGGEFAQLGYKFNQMADNLAAGRVRADREAEARVKLERDLRHTERLASVGQIAAGVAHELGAPLNVIDARAEQLLAKPDASIETRERNLRLIRKQAARITHIVRQLLNLARPYNLHYVNVKIVALVRDTLEALNEDFAKQSISVNFNNAAHDQPSENLQVFADADFLRQVFTNIFINAAQAMPDGGYMRVEIAATNRRQTTSVAAPQTLQMRDVTAAKNIDAEVGDARFIDGRFISVSVSDTGCGISLEHLAHVFEPFYTTKDVGSNTGLGLAVARRIIEEHGGWIEASNNTNSEKINGDANNKEIENANRGATFTVYLPQVLMPETSTPEPKLFAAKN